LGAFIILGKAMQTEDRPQKGLPTNKGKSWVLQGFLASKKVSSNVYLSG